MPCDSTQVCAPRADCWDCEVDTSYGWIECAGLADRSAFDLTNHAAASKVDLVAWEQYDKPRQVEVVEVVPQMKVLGKALKQAGKAVAAHLEAMAEDDALALKARPRAATARVTARATMVHQTTCVWGVTRAGESAGQARGGRLCGALARRRNAHATNGHGDHREGDQEPLGAQLHAVRHRAVIRHRPHRVLHLRTHVLRAARRRAEDGVPLLATGGANEDHRVPAAAAQGAQRRGHGRLARPAPRRGVQHHRHH